jgi:hypothetical protein
MSQTTDDTHDTDAPDEITVARLGQQQKELLRWLYDRRGRVHDQVDIIEALYGDVTDGKKASVSRSISKLRDAGLMRRKTAYYDEYFDAMVPQRPKFGLTNAGESFLVEDDRFPEITGETEYCVDCGDEAETFPDGTPLCHRCQDNRIVRDVRG